METYDADTKTALLAMEGWLTKNYSAVVVRQIRGLAWVKQGKKDVLAVRLATSRPSVGVCTLHIAKGGGEITPDSSFNELVKSL